MPSLRETLKKRIINDMLRAVNPPSRWKILVVDAYALRLLNSCCKMPDVLSENISVVEGLSNKRQAHPDKEAIYFISPTLDSVRAVIDDYSKTRPPYAAAHVFTTSALSDQLFERIQHSPAINHLRTCKELNIDFFAPDSQSFIFDYPDSWYTLFNPHAPSLLKYELDHIAKRIVSVLATLGEYPYIRYHTRPVPFSTAPQKSLSQDLAVQVQEELDKLCRHDPSFPPQSTFKRPVLIITDRSIDMISPLLHEFSYQAVVGDLIGLETGKYKDRRDGSETIVDESDPIWAEVRTWHIAEVLSYLPELFKRFTSENKAAKWELEKGGGENSDKIQDLKDAMGSLGVYQDMKAKYALHTFMCEDVMNRYKERMLEKISEVEQNLVMADPTDASKTRLLLSDVFRILEDSSIQHLDKIRLIMLAIISQGGVQDSDRQRFLERGALTVEESQALTNLSLLSVRLSPSLDKKKVESKNPYVYAETVKRSKDKVFKFENSRYTPMLKYIAEDQCKNAVDQHVFPWIKDPPVGEYGDRPSTWSDPSFESAISPTYRKKPSWATRKTSGGSVTNITSVAATSASSKAEEDFRENGPRVILFVIGGITYSEMRAVFEAKKDLRRDIVIGSTHVWQPDGFVEALKDLHRGQGAASRFMTFHRSLPPPPADQRSSRSQGGPKEAYMRGDSRGGSPRGASPRNGRPSDPRDDPRSRKNPSPRSDPRAAQNYDPRGDPRGDPRDGSRNDPRGDPRSGSRGDPRGDPRNDPRNGSRGDPRNDPRGDSRNGFRGNSAEGLNSRSPPQDDFRSPPPQQQRTAPTWSRTGRDTTPQAPPPQQYTGERGMPQRNGQYESRSMDNIPGGSGRPGRYPISSDNSRQGNGSMSQDRLDAQMGRMGISGQSRSSNSASSRDSPQTSRGQYGRSTGSSSPNSSRSQSRGYSNDPIPLGDSSRDSAGGSREGVSDKLKSKKGWFGFK
ncbi:syntaxin binding protein 1 [Batrachochytrium dendrobatidis]|nr:syntaxin binding protein 1 [Batrachochytrium dendrobatidis]KAK5671316.1 syntaxin binding protein 1 [Batrachochytrium dendrobatidis]